MTTPTGDKGPWCTVCGHPGEPEYPSLSAERPIGRCRRGAPTAKGCGRVILTTIRLEAEDTFDARRRRFATKAHPAHLRAAKRNPYCDECSAIAARTGAVGHGR